MKLAIVFLLLCVCFFLCLCSSFYSFWCHRLAWPRGYKTFFMPHSTEHEISTAHKKTKIPTKKEDINPNHLNVPPGSMH